MKKLIILFCFSLLFFSFKKHDISWVAIGDSITYLNDHTNETGNRVTSGYMTMVTKALPNIHFTNQGHNGWTASKIADNIEKLGLVKADVYSVFLGTNDWWHGGQLGTFADYQNTTGSSTVYGSFKIIINKLRSLNSLAKIILITPMQRSDFVYINNFKNNAYGSYKDKNGQWLQQFAIAIDSIANYEKLSFIDLYHNKKMAVEKLVNFKKLKDPQTGNYKNYKYPDYTNIPFNADSDLYPYPAAAINITYDGLHPSDKGNKIIAKKLVRILKHF